MQVKFYYVLILRSVKLSLSVTEFTCTTHWSTSDRSPESESISIQCSEHVVECSPRKVSGAPENKLHAIS